MTSEDDDYDFCPSLPDNPPRGIAVTVAIQFVAVVAGCTIWWALT